MREVLAGVSLALVLLAAGCSGGAASSESGAGSDVEIVGDRSLAGGATTTTDRTSQAFENPASNLSSENLELHFAGDIDFGQSFVTAPAPIAPGLGPLFNNRSCESCHTKNGRGSPILGTGGLGSQALVRVSVAQGAAALPGAPSDVPGIGTQIQDHAIFGQIPEATIELTWKYFPGALPDGQSYELRSPVLKITLPNGTHLSGDVMTSLRMPQPVFGLGLLEAIPEDRLLSLTDPEDADNDGISGRANVVFDAIKGTFVLGRFGRKANQPTLIQQVASAYANDMGIGNPVFSDSEGNLDIDFSTLDSSTFYVQTLAVPRAIDVQKPEVKEGEGLFLKIGCGSCHVPSHLTGTHPIEELSQQRIYPFTDLLLHDMGPGLADGREDFDASGTEWRTSPLWGIGATKASLSNSATYLHDGRARSLLEAILWHGGEAENAKVKFTQLSSDKRELLINFLNTL